MNSTLYKTGIMGSWRLWIIFLAIMSMYIGVVISMFDPDLGSIMNELTAAMPEVMALFGMKETGGTLLEFMASYLYGMIFLVFPMVYTILTANRLIAKHVDRGSMAYLLAAPVSRGKVASTQLLVLITGIVLLILVSAGVGAAAAEVMFPGQLDYTSYVRLNAGVLLTHLLIAGICYLSSCIFNDTKWSVAFGAGVPVLCYVIQMIANLGGHFENVKYATFFTLFSPTALIQGDQWVFPGMLLLAALSLMLFAGAIAIFKRKDVPV